MESKNNIRKIAVLVCLFMALAAQVSQGQTFAEFFKQKKTQKKYLLEQIAALQVYIGYAKKGYDIADIGLQTIKGFTGGEFSLHNTFITSLKAVNPVIRKHVKVGTIIECQIRISKAFDSIRYNDMLSLANQLYIINVHEKLSLECGKDLEELLLVITSGKLEMRDEERIRRLDCICESMVDKYAFTMDFMEQVTTLIRQAEQEQQFVNQLRRSYEIN